MQTVYIAMAVLVLAAGVCATPAPFPSAPPSNVTRWTVDLAGPPEAHFSAVVAAHKTELGALLAFINQAIPAKYVGMAEKVAADLDFAFGPVVAAELRGIADASGFELGQIVLLNVLYELTAGCTSILAVQPDGTLLHARNLDYGLPYDLEQVTVEIDFVRGNVSVFTATTFAGFAGVLTGMSPVLSVTVDERDKGYVWENAFAALVEGGKAITFVLRDILDAPSPASFADTIAHLTSVHLIAPSYVIVGGTSEHEAVVVTRNRVDAANVWPLNIANGTWYLVETNYDHWLPDPPKDPRRTFAINHLDAITRPRLTPVSLLSVVATPPVLNDHTIYTILACARTQQYVSYLRSPKIPPVA